MDTSTHTISGLFAQLGLDNSEQAIQAFIQQHANELGDSEPLYKASFWSPSQASFLQQALEEDADWAEVVDSLDAMLRH